jgi:serine phosphatase RsbU (regulator of sigma subunit)
MAKPALLVVDDELPNLQKLRRTFVQDFEVYAAQSGEEALQMLRERTFRAIITDQRMPGSSGVDLLRESLKHSPHAIRIILTGYTDVEDLMGAINEGHVHRYITKPWDPFSLRHTVLQDVEHWDLKRENEFFVQQMEIAAEVQRMLYPRALPPFPRLDYVGVCRPARIVGGDYYDFLPVQPGRLLISLGDISGKGISAALLMANLQGLVRSLVRLHEGQVEKLAEAVNRELSLSIDGSKFASLFCALFDADSGSLDYVNAGHCPVLIFRAGGGPTERLEPTGTVLGLFQDARFARGQARLATGDLLVAYTDGVVEAESFSQKEFGEERLNELVRAHAGRPLPELAETLLGQVARFAADVPQQDDRTVVLARVRD